jgi:transposase
MKWAKAPAEREQMVLFSRCIDEIVPRDHRVRTVDQILGGLDWGRFESGYCDQTGQPAIHPRVIASVILYGHMVKIRSSRGLEGALQERVDFKWLVEGRSIDHTTISEFRLKFGALLSDIGAQMAIIAHKMGVTTLTKLAQDGTRMRASNARRATAAVEKLDELQAGFRKTIEELEQQVREADLQDSEDARLEASRLGDKLNSTRNRAAAIDRAKAEIERARAEEETIPNRVPLTDVESRVTPNKQTGFAPNFTPVATVDLESGLILDSDVRPNTDEEVCLVPSVDRIEQNLAERGLSIHVESVSVDSRFIDGPNLKSMRARGTDLLGPVTQVPDCVIRSDGSQPITAEHWDELPTTVVRKARGDKPASVQFTKEAFLQDTEQNCYWCPAGQKLRFAGKSRESKRRHGKTCTIERTRYEAPSSACVACALKSRCLQTEESTSGRTLTIDEYEPERECLRVRMKVKSNQALHALRQSEGERPFALIKHVFGIRHWLLRGTARVCSEWGWITSSVNLMILTKLVRESTAAGTPMSSGDRGPPIPAGA